MKMSRQVALKILGCCCLCGTMLAVGVEAEQAAKKGVQPAVAVVVGTAAPELERYAAGEFCRYLEQLYGIRTTPAGQIPTNATAICLVGSPSTNHIIAQAVGPRGWPKLSDQGLVLKHVLLDGNPAMIVGGDSPRATMWAVYELVERLGIRYLQDRDMRNKRDDLRKSETRR